METTACIVAICVLAFIAISIIYWVVKDSVEYAKRLKSKRKMNP
jgi:hypothetical protein